MHDPDLKDPGPADDPVPVQPALADPRARRRMLRPRRAVIAAVVAAALAAIAAVALASSGGSGQGATASAGGTKPVQTDDGPALPPPLKQRPKAVQAVGPGQAPPGAGVTAGNHSGKPSRPETDDEVRAELSTFREHLQSVGTPQGPIAKVLPDGTAVAPRGVPGVVLAVMAAGNEIATKPYKWGGGHGAWRDSGYDCSGSISFALAGAGLLNSPLNSTGFMKWGDPGRGRWITILANDGHAFMVVAGLRFDTSGAQGGTRWQPMNGRSYSGFVARHPPGL